ncbi:hypothetical protein I302_102576 [Kwoniella bestiolae CBS 10118]|uniref:Uncharacterized protein n=1 Tax=Kwoniella bestiolae CBS 10118 TaxID=1296100 RepID=A0A1B9GFC3_9TREE|nr:hypothetical protein I302_01263 [Kwoniella bestiolae CBS 10118]OCF29750.1 hypothetical protein I302_01263 [Kwoniella bestiolae CBS 10118]
MSEPTSPNPAQPIKWKDLLQCSPEETHGGKTISPGDPYTFPSPSPSLTYTSPTLRLLPTGWTKPSSNSPEGEGGFIRYIWWHAFHPDRCHRPGEIKSFLDITLLTLHPFEGLKGCNDIILHLNHPMGYMGLLYDLCPIAKEKMDEDIPCFKNEWDEEETLFDERRYEWTHPHDKEKYIFESEGRLEWIDKEGIGREERVKLEGDVGFWTVRLPGSIRGLRERRLGRNKPV